MILTQSKYHQSQFRFPHISYGLVWLIFFISPILSLPWIIRGCYLNKRPYYIIASLFAGLCGMLLFPPIGDQYQHALTFYSLQGYDWNDYMVKTLLQGRIEVVLNSVMFLFNKIGLPFGYIRLLFSSIICYLFLLLYDSYSNIEKSQKAKKLIFLTLFLLYPIAGLCSGMRYVFAICLVSYVFGKWQLFHKHSWIDLILIIIAFFTHIGCSIPISIYILSNCLPNRINRGIYILILIISFILSNSAFKILDYIPLSSELNDYVSEYATGKYTSSEYVSQGLNFLGQFKMYVSVYGSILVIIYIVLYRYIYNHSTKYLYVLIIGCALTSSMFSVNGRIISVAVLWGGLTILRYYTHYRKVLCLSLLSIFLFINILNWRQTLSTKYIYLFSPYIVAMNSDYDLNWIQTNVNEDGILRAYW